MTMVIIVIIITIIIIIFTIIIISIIIIIIIIISSSSSIIIIIIIIIIIKIHNYHNKNANKEETHEYHDVCRFYTLTTKMLHEWYEFHTLWMSAHRTRSRKEDNHIESGVSVPI